MRVAVICEALWPDSDAQTGARSLHVAISALRGAFVAAVQDAVAAQRP